MSRLTCFHMPADHAEAVRIQRRLADRVRLEPLDKFPRLVAGADVAFLPRRSMGIAALVVVSGFVLPFFEELFYRGFVMTAMLRSGSAAAAIVGSAVLFGAVHAPLWAHLPALMVLGVGLGYAYYRTRSLWTPVLMHTLFNLYNLTISILVPWLVNYANSGADT